MKTSKKVVSCMLAVAMLVSSFLIPTNVSADWDGVIFTGAVEGKLNPGDNTKVTFKNNNYYNLSIGEAWGNAYYNVKAEDQYLNTTSKLSVDVYIDNAHPFAIQFTDKWNQWDRKVFSGLTTGQWNTVEWEFSTLNLAGFDATTLTLLSFIHYDPSSSQTAKIRNIKIVNTNGTEKMIESCSQPTSAIKTGMNINITHVIVDESYYLVDTSAQYGTAWIDVPRYAGNFVGYDAIKADVYMERGDTITIQAHDTWGGNPEKEFTGLLGQWQTIYMDNTLNWSASANQWNFVSFSYKGTTPFSKFRIKNVSMIKGKLISFGSYLVKGSNISNILPGTKYSNMASVIGAGGSTISFKDKTGVAVSNLNNNISNGSTVSIDNGYEIFNYSLLIYGDISSDGLIAVDDLALAKNYLLKISPLDDIAMAAGDIYGVGNITISSLLAIKKDITTSTKIAQTYSYGPYLNNVMINRSIVREGNVTRIANVMRKAQNGEAINIGVIGGSITGGAGADYIENTYGYNVYMWWKTKFPGSAVTYTNAGIGATGSIIGVARAEADLLSKSPDIVIVDFSVNDNGWPEQTEAYESLIRNTLNSSKVPGVMLLAFGDQVGFNVQSGHKIIADHYDMPMISYRDAIWPEITSNNFTWSDFGADYVHPNNTGHKLAAKLVNSKLNSIYADLANISNVVGALPTPLYGNRFANATLYTNQTLSTTTNTGWEIRNDMYEAYNPALPMAFKQGWKGTVPGSYIEFSFTGKKVIGIVFKTIMNESIAGNAKVYLDGVQVANPWAINPSIEYPYVEKYLLTDTAANHVLKIEFTGTLGTEFDLLGVIAG